MNLEHDRSAQLTRLGTRTESRQQLLQRGRSAVLPRGRQRQNALGRVLECWSGSRLLPLPVIPKELTTTTAAARRMGPRTTEQ